MNPVATLTVRECMRSRPLGVGILEELAGSAAWRRMDVTMAEFCSENALDLDALQHRLATLPENSERQPWHELPLYFLIDHLTAEHRAFRVRHLPEVHRLLEDLRMEFPLGSEDVDAIIGEYKAFRQEFSWHMEEEEEFLFPKILRTEASLRHPDLYPESYKGSVRMFSPVHSHAPEDAFHALITGLNGKLRGMVTELSQISATKDVLEALQAFEARLRAHTFIESQILMPRAIVMEESLLRRVA